MPTYARTGLAAQVPIKSTDPNTLRRSRLLSTLLGGMIALSALFIPLELLDNSIPETLAIGTALVVMLVAFYINRRGRPTPAAYLFLGTSSTIVSMLLITRSSATSAFTFIPYMFALPIIAAGVTANRRAAFGVAALATAVIIAADGLLPHWLRFEARGAGPLHPLGDQADPVNVATILVFLFLCAFLSYSLERIIVAAIKDTDRLATDLAQAEAQVGQRVRDQQLAAAVRAQAAALAATVQQHSVAATQQSAAVQEITVTVEQLAATAGQIAGAGQDVEVGVGRVLQAVEQGQESDAATSRSIARLDTQVAAMAAQMQGVEHHVGEISQITDVLAEIADTIHLLALNATIEAAGAGTAGRRFAVVAGEVQLLAERVRQSSAQVRGQVTDIQRVAAGALATTRVGQQAALDAVEQTAQTRNTHAQIRTIVAEANEQADQIAQGTDQQRMAAGQVLFTLRAFGETVQEMAEGSSRVAEAAGQLSTLAGALDIGPPPPPGDLTRPDPTRAATAPDRNWGRSRVRLEA